MDIAAFGARIERANAAIKNLTGSISVQAGPVSEAGMFSEVASAGRVTALTMSLLVKEGGRDVTIKILITDGKLYLGGSQILAALKAGSKQWALVTSRSSNVTLRNLAEQLNGLLGSTGTGQYALFAKAARSVVDSGATKLGSVDAHKYLITVDVANAAAQMTGTNKAILKTVLARGVTTIPTTVWLDKSDRVVQASSTLTVSGNSSTTLFKVKTFNTALVIKAPPAAEVSTP